MVSIKTPKVIIVFLLLKGCEPFVTEFDESSEPVLYTSSNINKVNEPYVGGNVKVLTWNIRFGVGRFPFFGDSCGDEVITRSDNVVLTMEAIADTINQIGADIVLLQEVDVGSKRTGYWNQVQYLLDNTYLNYGLYASMWKADFIPTDGIGRINTGNAILSKHELTDAERIQLRLRTDQSDLVQYFYLRRNILKAKIPYFSLGGADFYALNIHATAFATDDTKEQHIGKYIDVLTSIDDQGDIFVTGGDLNAVPPGALTDYCLSDFCDGENYHVDGADPYHKEGSYFDNFPGEPNILLPLYNQFSPAIDTTEYNKDIHFTHAPSTSTSDDAGITKHDRKLDYLFTNRYWEKNLSQTHQGAWKLSDHMPVSSLYKPLDN